jgi:hypothetical protein
VAKVLGGAVGRWLVSAEGHNPAAARLDSWELSFQTITSKLSGPRIGPWSCTSLWTVP